MLVLTTFQRVSPTSLLKIEMNNDNINVPGKLDLLKPTMSQSYTKNSRQLRKIMNKRGDFTMEEHTNWLPSASHLYENKRTSNIICTEQFTFRNMHVYPCMHTYVYTHIDIHKHNIYACDNKKKP